MKKKELEYYKKKLIELKEKISGVYEHLTNETLKEQLRETTGELSGYSLHMADAGTDNYDMEFTLNIAGRENEILHAIDEALEKIENNTYGKCEICGKEISQKRLEAIPYATKCVKCKEELERERV